VTFLDSKLNRLLQIDIPPVDQTAPESERPISRIALRKILLEGLENVVVFDKTFGAYEPTPEGRISVRFKDGSTAVGDIVVGADGASSHVRDNCCQTLGASTQELSSYQGNSHSTAPLAERPRRRFSEARPWSRGRTDVSSLRARWYTRPTPRAPMTAMIM
jgi:2-polyprenyl-6-methoxyphenol hydroxylase-like FAD-dependent oxidoreductase